MPGDVAGRRRKITAAIESLQKALALVDREMPLRVYEAIGAVGGALLESGHILAAQAHLVAACRARAEGRRSRSRSARGAESLFGLADIASRSAAAPPLADRMRHGKTEAEKASRLADHGKWQQAVAAIDRLGAKYGADPTLVYNRALLGGWLADDRALVAGLHAYAQMDVPLDDAVEAEAIAQLLDADLKEARLDSVVQSYEIKDLDGLVARLLSDKRVQSFEMDPAAFAERDQPRPRHTYVLLDRPMPETGVGITREAYRAWRRARDLRSADRSAGTP